MFDPESQPLAGESEFSDEKIRRGFIRKVYLILTCQLGFTSGIVAVFTYHEPTKMFVQTHMFVVYLAIVVMFVTLIAMACCEEVRRKTPHNFIFLGVFTTVMSVVLGVTASTYDSEAVLTAAALTFIVCLSLTLFAFQTVLDFTLIGAYLFVALIALIIFGIVVIFIPGHTIIMVYSTLGVLIFSLYLILDTQLMMGGKHKYSISPEEYIFAALNLYLDVVNIFMYLLAIVGHWQD